jgi:glycosyltransferase involved in cell wall biosynthesis
LDVFWGTNTFLPLLNATVRKVVTVHDFCYQVTPETFHLTNLWANRLFFMRDVRTADILLAVSEGTAYRLKELTGHCAQIVNPAAAESFTPQSRMQIQACLSTYDISYPYILNVTAWEPRKNLELLVKTFISMKRLGELVSYKLVLVGQKGWKCKGLEKLVTDNGGEDIVRLGYVSDKHLPSLYCGAALFIFPSTYEGFGIPALEARACGTRVVATDIPELREAAGPGAVFIEPTERGISDGILTALKQVPANPITPAKVTWEDGAMTLAAALRGEQATAKEHDN